MGGALENTDIVWSIEHSGPRGVRRGAGFGPVHPRNDCLPMNSAQLPPWAEAAVAFGRIPNPLSVTACCHFFEGQYVFWSLTDIVGWALSDPRVRLWGMLTSCNGQGMGSDRMQRDDRLRVL